MSNVKTGKVPSTATTASNSDFSGMSQNDMALRIHPMLEKILNAKQLVGRWLNRKDYVESGNFHKSGWTAYLVDEQERPVISKIHGVSADGTIVFRDLILGVKSKEEQEKHRARIQARNQRMQPGVIVEKVRSSDSSD